MGTALAPDVPGACLACMAEAERLDIEDGRPDEPYKFHAPPDAWMAEWEPEIERELEKVWRSEEQRTIDLLLALNRLWNMEEALERNSAALEKGAYPSPLPTASQIEVLARLGMAEFRRLTSS
jgi:hypothetical protein